MTDTPKPLRDMTYAEIGALLRAHLEGNIIEYWHPEGFWDTCYSDEPIWQLHEAYRVKPEPVEMSVHHLDAHGWLVFTYQVDDSGKPLPETVKMEVRSK